MKFDVSFYEDKNGKSETWDFIDNLRIKAQKSKDARIQYKQIIFYQYGTSPHFPRYCCVLPLQEHPQYICPICWDCHQLHIVHDR